VRSLPGIIAASVVLLGVTAVPVGARPPVPLPPPGAPLVGPAFGTTGAVTTACWLDVRYFRDLKNGVVDYCRGHLGYRRGALDCYQFTDRVCSVFLPDTVEWIETRQNVTPLVFACPDAPEPPVCPRLH
jgi:hypothetical protein